MSKPDPEILIEKLFKNQLNRSDLDKLLIDLRDEKKKEAYSSILERFFDVFFEKYKSKNNTSDQS